MKVDKEAILRNVIKRFLPQGFKIGTGFVIRSNGNNLNRNNIESSKQIDILIFETIPDDLVPGARTPINIYSHIS